MCHHDHRQGCHVFIYEPDSTIQGQLGSNSTIQLILFFTFFIVIIIFFFAFIQIHCKLQYSTYQTGILHIHMNMMMFYVMYTYTLYLVFY